MQSDLSKHASTNTASSTRINDQIDFPECARELIHSGWSINKLPIALQAHFWDALDLYANVGSDVKSEFSFPDHTDGFLPFGMEYAKATHQPDLCERYCYWHKDRRRHEAHAFSGSEFYRAICGYESGISEVAQGVLDSICGFFNVSDPVDIRNSSYIQLCAYHKPPRRPDREYLQNRHEDGHLLSIIKGNRDGLVIFPRGERLVVRLADDEMIVITGSLLTLLSDNRIPYMDHAVTNPCVPVARLSIVYFVIPDLTRKYTSFMNCKQLDLVAVANESHQAFGNNPFSAAA
ncbi:2OG-Fe(II) oxygenase family protein [Paraburkholderia humisilvae]|uniref:Isopenicillin N synthase-like Fe(2+) 2OG dioxygenase domain-containing protein n=1 Tax=Paraburkholderia humisilvae TaxID=627669 RepID=A0A6J5D6G2_9BURK|nr:2OG-Fe(II) oxygenase family protein [Paraburkholderia humisilvae]CAB3749989.1 hypothetical protein LMG29542_01161 [Paraburkholderia humisilvae]